MHLVRLIRFCSRSMFSLIKLRARHKNILGITLLNKSILYFIIDVHKQTMMIYNGMINQRI